MFIKKDCISIANNLRVHVYYCSWYTLCGDHYMIDLWMSTFELSHKSSGIINSHNPYVPCVFLTKMLIQEVQMSQEIYNSRLQDLQLPSSLLGIFIKLTRIVIKIFAINLYHHSYFLDFFYTGHFKQGHTIFF